MPRARFEDKSGCEIPIGNLAGGIETHIHIHGLRDGRPCGRRRGGFSDSRGHAAMMAELRRKTRQIRARVRDRRAHDAIEDLPEYFSVEQISSEQRRRMDPGGWGYRRSPEFRGDTRRDDDERRRDQRHKFRGSFGRRHEDEDDFRRRESERQFSRMVLGADANLTKLAGSTDDRVVISANRERSRRERAHWDRKRALDAFRERYPRFAKLRDEDLEELPLFRAELYDGLLGMTWGAPDASNAPVSWGTRDSARPLMRIGTLADLNEFNRRDWEGGRVF